MRDQFRVVVARRGRGLRCLQPTSFVAFNNRSLPNQPNAASASTISRAAVSTSSATITRASGTISARRFAQSRVVSDCGGKRTNLMNLHPTSLPPPSWHVSLPLLARTSKPARQNNPGALPTRWQSGENDTTDITRHCSYDLRR